MKRKKTRSGKTLLTGIILIACVALYGVLRGAVKRAELVSAATDAERRAYIESFGWECASVAMSCEEIRIPPNFDDAYEQYNAIQLEQGFDLREYRACYAKKYTYRIKDSADGAQTAPVPLYANLIVIEGKLVGADITCAELGGEVAALAKK